MLDAIDILEMLCTLNLTQFTPHSIVPLRKVTWRL